MDTLTMRILHAAAEADQCVSIWWRTDGQYAPITFFANCNDLFHWACADMQEINSDNIDVFEQSLIEDQDYGIELFCCRVRKMRPQTPYYKHIPKDIHYKFNECGEQR